MSPGPNTIRKVSRFRAHLDFTTRPRTGTTSVSKRAAGSITNLLFIDASPLPPACRNTTGATAGGPIARPPAEITLDGDVEREGFRAPGIGASSFSLSRSPPLHLWKMRRGRRQPEDYRVPRGTSTPYPPSYWEAGRR